MKSDKKHPLPAYPPSIALTFEKMCKPVSEQIVPLLENQLLLFRGKLSGWEARISPSAAKKGFALHESAKLLLNTFTKFNDVQRGLAAAAVQYLVREQDGVDDQRPIVGFDDDIRVMNHVLEELDMATRCIPNGSSVE